MSSSFDRLSCSPSASPCFAVAAPRDRHPVGRAVQSLFSSQCFIALCAVALTCESTLVAGAPAESWRFLLFVFLGTLAAYRVHASARGCRASVRWTVAALAGAVLLLPLLGRAHLAPIAIAAPLAWAYSMPIWPGTPRLREQGLLKLLTLTGVWTLITAVAPLLGHADTATIAFISTRRFLFMFALCLAFDIRDIEADRHAGIRTLPVLIGAEPSFRLIRVSLAAFGALSAIGLARAGLWQGNAGASLALIFSGLITWVVIEATRHRRSPLMYLALLDGMMLLQCVLVVAGGELVG